MLFHPQAESALVIGLGSGMTLGAVEQYPVKSIDVVELEKRVVEANEFFRPFNHQALDDPRVRLLVTDGRQHLTYTDRRYDVIISEPSNPWVSGMSSLFTREFFEQAKARLLDGGVICQWVHAYSMSSIDFQTILATFQSVFPRMGLWEIGPGGDYILLGFDHDQPIDLAAIRSRFADEPFRGDFATMNVRSAETLLAHVLLGPDEAVDYVAEAPIHTDDNALLEYSAPKSFFDAGRRPLLEDLYRHRAKPEGIRKLLGLRDIAGLDAAYEARSVVLEGFRWTLEREGAKAAESLTRALALDPRDADAVSMLHRLYNQTGKKEDALGRDDVALEAFERAAETIERFVDGDPSQLRHHFGLNVEYGDTLVRLGTLYFERDRIEDAKSVLERALEGDADNAEIHNNVGATYEAAGLLEEALYEFERAVEIHPSFASAHMNAANIYLRAGLFDRAIASYREAQRHRPEFEMTYYNLGVAFYQSGSWDEAEIEWARALALKPDFEEATKALARLNERRVKGETPPRPAPLIEQCLRLPGNAILHPRSSDHWDAYVPVTLSEGWGRVHRSDSSVCGQLTSLERLTMRDTDYRAAPSWAVAAAFVLFGFHAPGGEANEWPSFRGERAWGVADGTNPPVEWDVEQGSHIAWKTPISGMAHSSPIIHGERIYLTTAISARADTAFQFPLAGEMDRRSDLSEHQFRVLALDLKDGSVVWDELALEAEPRVARHPHSSYAAPTPATDGEYLVAFFGSEGLYTFDLSGKLLWKRDLGPLDQGAFDVPDYTWGYASSPIIYKNLTIVQCDQ